MFALDSSKYAMAVSLPEVSAVYTPVFTHYDGTGDYAVIGRSWSAVDGNKGTLSFLLTSKADGVARRIIDSTSNHVRVIFGSSDNMRIQIDNSSGTSILDVTQTGFIKVADGQVHVLIAWTTDGGGNVVIKVDGVDVTGTPSVDSADDVDYSEANGSIVASVTGANICECCISEFYFNTSEYITDATKFATGSTGISLGADGSTPSGTQPEWYIPNLLTATNLGSLGGSITNNGDPAAGCP